MIRPTVIANKQVSVGGHLLLIAVLISSKWSTKEVITVINSRLTSWLAAEDVSSMPDGHVPLMRRVLAHPIIGLFHSLK